MALFIKEKLTDLPTKRFKTYFDTLESSIYSTDAELEKGYNAQLKPEDASIKKVKTASVSLKKETDDEAPTFKSISPKLSVKSESSGIGSSITMSSNSDDIMRRLDGDLYQYRLRPNGEMVDAWYEHNGDQYGRDCNSLKRMFVSRQTNQFSDIKGDDRYLEEGTETKRERDESPVRASAPVRLDTLRPLPGDHGLEPVTANRRARAVAVSNSGLNDRFERFLDQVVDQGSVGRAKQDKFVAGWETARTARRGPLGHLMNPQFNDGAEEMTTKSRNIKAQKAIKELEKLEEANYKAGAKAQERQATSKKALPKKTAAEKRDRLMAVQKAADKKEWDKATAKAKLADMAVKKATVKNQQEKEDLIKGFREAARRRKTIKPSATSTPPSDDFTDPYWGMKTPEKTKPSDEEETTIQKKSASQKKRERRKRAKAVAIAYENAEAEGGGGGAARQLFDEAGARVRLMELAEGGTFLDGNGKAYTVERIKSLGAKQIKNLTKKFLDKK